jgi:hypothetical protein
MMNLAIAPTALYTTNVVNQSTSNTVSSNTPVTSSTVGDTFTPSQSATTREGVNFKKLIPTALLSPLVSFSLVACEGDGGKVVAPIAKNVLSAAVSCENNHALVIKGFDIPTQKPKPQGAATEWRGLGDQALAEAQKRQQAKENIRYSGLLQDNTAETTATPKQKEKFLTIVPAKQTGYDSAKCYHFQEAAKNKINQTGTLNQPLKPGVTKQVRLNDVLFTLVGGETGIIVKAGGQKVYIPN